MHWVKLTREPWPRLSLVREVLDDGADYLGPFSSRKAAEKAWPRCTRPSRSASAPTGCRSAGRRAACVLAEMGRCLLALRRQRRRDDYAAVVAEAAATRSAATPDEVVAAMHERMAALAGQERFEEAGAVRDRLAASVRAAARTQRLRALTRAPRSSPPAARTTALGGPRASATAGSPPPA